MNPLDEKRLAVHQLITNVKAAAECATSDKDWHILMQEVLRLRDAIRDLALEEDKIFDFYDSQVERGESGYDAAYRELNKREYPDLPL